MVEKLEVIFLLDNGTHFSVLPFSPSPRSIDKVIIQGIFGQPLEHYFTQLLAALEETSSSFILFSLFLKLQ
jgi:hypothetical protein